MTPRQLVFLANLDFKLPPGYQAALFANAGGPLVEQSAGDTIWGLDEVSQFNIDYQAEEWCPDFYLIGSNGGGEAYAIEKATGYFVSTPFIGHDETTPITMEYTWKEFVTALQARETGEDGE